LKLCSVGLSQYYTRLAEEEMRRKGQASSCKVTYPWSYYSLMLDSLLAPHMKRSASKKRTESEQARNSSKSELNQKMVRKAIVVSHRHLKIRVSEMPSLDVVRYAVRMKERRQQQAKVLTA
jgi:hypothetical protein